ncbi:MAG: FG-GAP-like repeat-containing protein [Candidatus Marinimicrobia bacterium]|nr:FG-GAP-like repeat-containing protein [Candidatus Neomarinimicrobiota bacterium]
MMTVTNFAFTQSISWNRVTNDGQYTGGFTNSSPTFADIDGDGDYDCFIGNARSNTENARVFYFENIGDPENSSWQLVTNSYNNIQFDYLLLINITFADIDADGDLDMFIAGDSFTHNHGIHYYENIGNSNNPEWQYITDTYQSIDANEAMGYFMKPTFADLDNDNDLDLLVGSYFGDTYYENIGDSSNASFEIVTYNYFDYESSHYCPIWADINSDGDYDCFIGLSSLLFYENIGSAELPAWSLNSENYNNISGQAISHAFCDLDGDDDFDLILGDMDGRLSSYENTGTPAEATWVIQDTNFLTIDAGFLSSPAFCDINGDNQPEMFILGCDEYYEEYSTKQLYYYLNINSPSEPVWELQPSPPLNLHYSENGPNSIDFADIDADGDMDLFVSLLRTGEIRFHENFGSAEIPQFDSTGTTIVYFGENENIFFDLSLVDIDADGDLDMFINPENGYVGSDPGLRFFRNIGSSTSPSWEYDTTLFMPFGGIDFLDEDNDGDLDLFISESIFIDSIYFYRNSGNQYGFDFVFETLSYSNIGIGQFPTICFHDMDQDGDKDLILGEYDGGINVFKNDGFVSVEKEEIVDSSLKLSAYPNPFNPVTTISYELPINSQVTLSIYDISGREVFSFAPQIAQAGWHTFQWNGLNKNGTSVPSGVYLGRLQLGEHHSKVIKMVCMK